MKKLPNKFYVIDTETTGLGPQDEIVEIAVINERGQAVLNTLVKPTKPIPLEATAIHGISDERVANAPSWDEVYPLFRDLLQDTEVFMYNAEFDLRLIVQTMELTYGISDQAPSLFKLSHGKIKSNYHCVMNMVNKTLGTERWVSLVAAAKHFGITFAGLSPHHAASDCAVTLDVLRAMHGLPPIATGRFARKYQEVL